MSYSLKVDVQHRETAAHDVPDPLSRAASSNAIDTTGETIAFSAGNPRVEYVTGVVHLYRDIPPEDVAARPAWTQHEGRGNQLAVLAVQPEMGVADFCTFLGGYLPSIRDMRFMRKGDSKSSCLVLLTFDTTATAASFHKERNNKPFWTLEPDVICRLVFVKDVQYADTSSGQRASLPSPGQTELPTCPVCLERLDNHISGIVTTVCNHRFHNECLMRWADTTCPVCRYCLSSDVEASHCNTCGASADLWICLICGHIGCGRYRSGHANGHWKESNHCYALELETQRVWDYASDGYVHRLIQSKTDGKLVEVPSPMPAAREQAAASEEAAASSVEERYRADMEEAMLSSKLDAIAAEYGSLLAGQLETQREWFEGRHAKAMAEMDARCAALSEASSQNELAAKAAREELIESARQRKAVEAKLDRLTSRFQQTVKERDVLEELNKQMRSNQQQLKDKLQAECERSRAAAAEKDAQIQDLQEQVRDLMMYIEGQRVVQESEALQEGSVSLPAAPPPAATAPKRRQRKGSR